VIRFTDLPIRFELALATAISSGLALLLASVSFLVFDRASFEEAMVRRRPPQAGRGCVERLFGSGAGRACACALEA